MLLRVARQSSLCDDDALDAYQRALEIFVRRVETVEPATEVAWLKVVVRHEAMAIRRARSESVTDEELDLDAFVPGSERSVDEQIAASERVRRSAEALRALKPDEAKALMMKAHGLSYEEIGARNGWTYTKVNRAITEGRRRFIAVFEGIESGEECERFAPIVEALAQGSATPAQLLSIRPHLRHCIACRAAVRDLHLSRLHRASLFFPGFLLLPVGRLSDLRRDISALFHRTNASDVATGVQLAATGGGGRIATVAAVLGLCLSSAGVGTVCVVSGIVSAPLGLFQEERPSVAAPQARPPIAHAKRTAVVVRATPTPAPSFQRRRPASAPRHVAVKGAAKDPSQGTKPTSHEHAPISPATASTTGRESFGPQAPQTPSQPAPPPATGGEEFGP
jgi:RNA polymerase sigma factor (sigma-70 family)